MLSEGDRAFYCIPGMYQTIANQIYHYMFMFGLSMHNPAVTLVSCQINVAIIGLATKFTEDEV